MPTLLTICGSLRADSWNRRALVAAEPCVPSEWTVVHADVRDIPLYDQDLETDGAPVAVTALRVAVAQADAVLLSTPQYNHGMSGVLKNTLDWLSRPAFAGVLVGKPCAVIAASPSRNPPIEAVTQTETTVEACVATVVRPGVAVPLISRAVDNTGAFTEVVLDPLADLVVRLVAAAERPEPPEQPAQPAQPGVSA